MSTWSSEEIRKIADTDDLHIAPFRDDGATCGTPTWIWSVVVDDGLYVRAYNGQASTWYKAALRQRAGRVYRGRPDEGSDLRTCRWAAQRAHR